MANIDRIDTPQSGGIAARVKAARPRAADGLRGADPAPPVAAGAKAEADRVELSAVARDANAEFGARQEKVAQVKAQIEADADGYIERTFNAHLDEIVDAIARDIFG